MIMLSEGAEIAHFHSEPVNVRPPGRSRGTSVSLFKAKLELPDLVWATWKARQGWSQKRIAAALEVSRWTLQRHLHACRRQRSESVGASVVLAKLQGSHRLHAAHMLVDLWELVHEVGSGRQPRLRDLARIRGEWTEGAYKPQDVVSTVRAFYRIKKVLGEHGIRFEKRIEDEDQSVIQAVIEFDVHELAEFVRREIGFAGRLIEGYAERTGDRRRFRGR